MMITPSDSSRFCLFLIGKIDDKINTLLVEVLPKDHRPQLSHMRESRAIEQLADVFIFVHREEYYHSREEAEEMGIRGQAEIIVAKHRNGPVGTVELAWIGEFTLFSNLAETGLRKCITRLDLS